MDKDFVAASIQAIGRCATNIGEVRDTCLNGLVQLLSNRDGESVCSHTTLTARRNATELCLMLRLSLIIHKVSAVQADSKNYYVRKGLIMEKKKNMSLWRTNVTINTLNTLEIGPAYAVKNRRNAVAKNVE